MKFPERVYELVRRIPPGKVLYYGYVAVLLNKPRGARAVGWALHQTPPGQKIPWHRVVNSSGKISTRCDEHDELRQRALLEAEGVEFDIADPLKIRHFNAILWSPSEADLAGLDANLDHDW